MPMNPEIKAMWVEALRSGEFKQTRQHLQNSEGFCCLGVLCEMHRRTETGGKTHWRSVGNAAGSKTYQNSVALLPYGVRVWAIGGDGSMSFDMLSYMNDQGNTFAQIADVIERKY